MKKRKTNSLEKRYSISRQAIYSKGRDRNNVDSISMRNKINTKKHVLDNKIREQMKNEEIKKVDKQKEKPPKLTLKLEYTSTNYRL